jgi:hypothetical protein
MKPARTTLILLTMIFGYGKADKQPATANTHKEDISGAGGSRQTSANNVHGHSHERGKMLLTDVGTKYHALLTAHLSSKDGNELDIFFGRKEADAGGHPPRVLDRPHPSERRGRGQGGSLRARPNVGKTQGREDGRRKDPGERRRAPARTSSRRSRG